MGKKLSYTYVKDYIESVNYKLLSKIYINQRTKLELKCTNNHIYWVTFSDFKHNNHRCPYCAGNRKYTLEYVKDFLSDFNYKCISNEYKGNLFKLIIKCDKGHIYKANFSTLLQGHRCPYCAGLKKKTIEEIKEYAKSEGYTCLSNTYKNALKKLSFMCQKGHIFKMTWRDFHTGHRCSECLGCKKKTFDEVKTFIEAQGYILLSDCYKNSRSKLILKCSNNHTFYINWSDFKQGKRCRQCYLDNNKGENHLNYNKDLTDEYRITNRKYYEYYEWRKAVYKKDNYMCVKCFDSIGGNLNAHHIESYGSNINKRVDVNNGITLCKKCHINFHHQYGYGNNTKEQFNEFIRRSD